MESAIGACASAGSPSKSGHVQSTVVRQTAGIVASPSDLTYEIWSDGACAHKTTGAGGYAAVLIARRSDGITAKQWEVFGGAVKTTNNRMELMAVITGLRDLPAPARVCIFIDSTYVKKNFGDWLERWQSNGWRTADGKPVKNRDLWKELFTEVACRKVKWVPLNERADQLACAQRDAYAKPSRRRPVE
jgi:ribonuclease HI